MTWLEKIISGGQTGADRAALCWAIEHQVPHGGWCPLGRAAEDGAILKRFDLEETPSEGYAQRTEWNVRDSDATVIFSISRTLTGGSKLTEDLARKWKRPFLHLSLNGSENAAQILNDFLDQYFIRTLNIAGPRDSTEPGIGDFVQEVLSEAYDT